MVVCCASICQGCMYVCVRVNYLQKLNQIKHFSLNCLFNLLKTFITLLNDLLIINCTDWGSQLLQSWAGISKDWVLKFYFSMSSVAQSLGLGIMQTCSLVYLMVDAGFGLDLSLACWLESLHLGPLYGWGFCWEIIPHE